MNRSPSGTRRQAGPGPSWRRIIEAALRGGRALTAVLLAAITVIVIYGVFTRYVLGHAAGWTFEAAANLFVWLTFLGAPVVLWEGRHIGFDLVTLNLRAPWGAGVRALRAAVLAAINLVILVTGVEVAYTIRLNRLIMIPWMPSWIVSLALPLSGLLFAAGLLVEGAGADSAEVDL